jgi:deaminated glutathione amidase
MKVAAIQMVSSPELADNLHTAERLIAQAVQQGCELVAFPEYFCFMGHQDSDKLALAEPAGQGPIQDRMARLAREHAVWIVAGTMPIKTDSPSRARNCCLVFDPRGEQVARYDKLHLFAFDNGRERYDEARVLEPGSQAVAFNIPSRDGHVWRVGLSICYDLRFPELYRALAADLLLVPSAFTETTGRAHWEVLLRARAIENLAYLMAPAQGGEHRNGRRTWGHTLIANPWGEVLAQHTTGEAIVTGALDATLLQRLRDQLPALSHRRASL